MPGPGKPETVLSPDELAQARRDLRWLLLSPPLLNRRPGAFAAPVQAFDEDERGRIATWLDGLDADPRPLAAHLADPRPSALGRRAEQLLHFFLRHGPTHRLLAAHLPVRDGAGATLGEIDFLVEDLRGERWHWELAVKFYLCTRLAGHATPREFIGPNGREVFASKLERLFGHQLVLNPPPPWHRQAWRRATFVRGWMFYLPGASVQADCLADDHLRGLWVPAGAETQALPGPLLPLPRARWMSPAVSDTGLPDPHDPPDPNTGPGARLYASLAPAGLIWRERGRVFVVPPEGLRPGSAARPTPAA